MVSNYDRYSNCTSPTLNKTDYASHSNRLNLYVDNKPVTPWIRGEVIHEGMLPVDKGYVQKNIFGRRYYGNNNMKFYHSGNTGTGGGGGGGGVGTNDGGGGGGGGGNVYNYYGRKRGRTYNRHYYHEGQRAYNNNNNHRSRYPFTCSPTVYPLSRSQSSYNIDSDINNNNSDDYHYDYKNHGRVHRYSNCSYTMNNDQLTDEYIDDCLSTDIEQYQLKFDINNQYIHHNYQSKHLTITNNNVNNIDDWTKVKTSSPSSSTSSSSPSTDSDFVSNDISQPSSSSSSSSSPSTSSSPSSTSSSSSSSNHQIINNHLYNESKQLQHKCKSSLNLSTSCIIVYDTNNNEDYIDVNHHIHDNVENQRESMEYDNDQKDCKSGNMNDYLTLVWGDLPETLENS
ncbi:Suppressor of the cold-sensitive snRNP biogenesis mutant brr1-1 [Schistosoma haematobium]|uniref:Suppressor of the cold-sensitive snRNP biogenesis mutant brr1-1 n=1 Tax=Schistosoma haematobium TaxID=6185 RepID=A0A922S4S1_SCHHA|nr:Suppressor of the cold-sensitive snRNP biogenesis mutant brr1-1 [Schistosoma haematobium]KAH9593583.1 Suppressor of the cold-sensitive snRNP biogenesis mutant brr1-1 [Schistosoma haematobium]CAH8428715.1 unnamed protein product [Schistosoma haematobium]